MKYEIHKKNRYVQFNKNSSLILFLYFILSDIRKLDGQIVAWFRLIALRILNTTHIISVKQVKEIIPSIFKSYKR